MKTVKKFARVNVEKTDEALPDSSAANARAIAGGTDLLGPSRFEMLPASSNPCELEDHYSKFGLHQRRQGHSQDGSLNL